MAFWESVLIGLAQEGIKAGANVVKKGMADMRAADEAREAEMKAAEEARKTAELARYIGAAFRLPKGYCEGATGRVWRVIDNNSSQLLLRIKVSGGKVYEHWFSLSEIRNYYENV